MSDNFADTEFAGHTEGKTADYCSRTKIGQLIRMIAYAFLAAVVTVYECSVGLPFEGTLVFQLLSIWIKVLDPSFDLCIDSVLYLFGNRSHLREGWPHIGYIRAIVHILRLLALCFVPRVHIETYAMWALDYAIKQLELIALERGCLG